MECDHRDVVCLNHYDQFRKYRCQECGAILMCACERLLAETFLPHQTGEAQEYGTGRRFRVDGYAHGICNTCRGLAEESHPRAAIWGQKGKVERFYWREIFTTYCEFLLAHYEQDFPYNSVVDHDHQNHELARELRSKAKKHWQEEHKRRPKYELKERTEADFLSQVPVPVKELSVQYRKEKRGKQSVGRWLCDGELLSVEQLAARHYSSEGYSVIRCERVLISAWVATFLGAAIQDPADPRGQAVMRGSTIGWRPDRRDTPIIHFRLPQDFGSAHYYARRQSIVDSWLDGMRAVTDLQVLFDALVPETEYLRDYLWVAEPAAVEAARHALGVLPREFVVAAVHWAIQHFWDRQPGWPDLLVWSPTEFLFVEVKSPHDKLSQKQMNWFEWAVLEQNVPCEILRLKRARETGNE